MTYTITIKLSVGEDAEQYLGGVEEIRNEVRSWLEGLGATIHEVEVQGEEK